MTERKERLATLIDRRNRTVQFSRRSRTEKALFEAAQQQHFEGIVAKKRDSCYFPGKRTKSG